ncbi:MAG: hypothetical protein ACE5D0_07275 [Fidelibacterota bacterium]
MFRNTKIALFLTILCGQEQDTLVKYFPTDIIRSEILGEESSKEEIRGKAHFKSTYTPQGKLINVEYFPDKAKQSQLSGMKLYYGYWNPEKRELADGLNRNQLDGREFYQVTFNQKGRIKTVTLFNRQKEKIWSYYLVWNKAGTRSKYEVIFHIREPLTRYDEFLYADNLSEMRQNWRLEIKEREDGRPQTVTIKDELGQIYYFYQFQYIGGKKKSPEKELIISEYFRDDSSKVGMHKLYYNKKDYLFKAKYYNEKDSLLSTQLFNYMNAPKEILLTLKDGMGILLEKRIIPFSKKYKRRLESPKDKTGLADVMSFLNETTEEDLRKLVQSIEGKFNVTVELDTVIKKNISEVKYGYQKIEPDSIPEHKVSQKRKRKKQNQPFVLEFNVSNDILAGQYLGADNIFSAGLGLGLPISFDIFWFSLVPTLNYGQIRFLGSEQTSATWINLESPDFIPLKFPLILHGAVGTVGPGFGIKGGIETKFHMGVDITIGTSAVIANNIDGNRQTTGYISVNLGVNYILPF